ncbi:glucose-1-phosphate adenylyltransferase subunit GlgD [Parasporobacterium paucivorans]|uniref:Glucose-1-phosphate adenylyltransferase n=1 Tax=Parasporobacterium paucivorans DSM 15970 TaxID=1122934 RepID=A0A1M6G648_9FIRM|nr:glucose-1-phosphate adenylyltransferase subunit GlgD [Parasporobacterium paucivorans]SHJ05419.1 glucose-1-phosphate adenylyltransferase [Parasporobacterium paucivorans DSM 15970]
MDMLGIIFSDVGMLYKSDLAMSRSTASIPFGGRYRLVDFHLSNMVNSGIHDIFILPQTNFFSLAKHIATGKDWNLSRKQGGISIFPPYSLEENVGLYKSRLDALKRILNFITNSKANFVILSDSDTIYNIDFGKALEFHQAKGADITSIYTVRNLDESSSVHETIYYVDPDKRIHDIMLFPVLEGLHNVSVGAWIFDRDILISTINDAISHNYIEFKHAVMALNLKKLKVYGFEHTGYFTHINSIQSYYDSNMHLLKKDCLRDLFYSENGPIYTKTKDSTPTRYCIDSFVKNSLVASGCSICGTVENSVIFRNVKIGKNALVKNCILMPHTVVGENTRLSSVVTDMNVRILDDRTLLGTPNCPFYIKKNMIV